MSQRDAWSTAQVPFLVPGPAGYVPTDPAKKAEDAATLAAQVAAFRKAGGKVEVITEPTYRPQKSSKRRSAKA
ncbi:TPA: hypothetical protein ACOEPM_004599 [Stenotrophomonas maltophilia]|uniref:hypothetical protein n=1 Tax=Stenotrophomonas maltophilia TaxID=40324 RepID=UPI00131296BD|nr:hypothetical protein [Stenotrophomonas maltophilia]MBN5037813.1 hypothetical protein [Stenotrophomonas maltophilia]MDZ5779091.1 hypothetical protein [Stenotrophomonas maltophilia]HEL4187001.1 hypothetical protein [Stenotrophomonas maltophilia]